MRRTPSPEEIHDFLGKKFPQRRIEPLRISSWECLDDEDSLLTIYRGVCTSDLGGEYDFCLKISEVGDDEIDTIQHGECSCPAYLKINKPCKHLTKALLHLAKLDSLPALSDAGATLDVDICGEQDHHNLELQARVQIPRFSSSDVSALADLHEYRDTTELFDKYLYQDLSELQRIDAQAMGVSLITLDESVQSISNKLSTDTAKTIQSIRDQSRERLSSERATAISAEIIDLCTKLDGASADVTDLTSKGILSGDEVKELQESMLYELRTNLGNHHEAAALDRYHEVTGRVIEAANELQECLVWHVPRGSHDEMTSGGVAKKHTVYLTQPRRAFLRYDTDDDRKRLQQRYGSDETTVPNSTKHTEYQAVTSAEEQAPAFYIVGLADGIVKQGQAVERIVEVKTRLKRIHPIPHLHDIVQMSVYMILHGCGTGDLVQYKPAEGEKESDNKPKTKVIGEKRRIDGSSTTATDVEDFKITEVNLFETGLQSWSHGGQFFKEVLPRLHRFRDALVHVRSDASRRYAWVGADEAQRRDILNDWFSLRFS